MSLNENKDGFTYTKEYPVTSSVIDSVYYDENAHEALLDVNDNLYLYSGVSPSDVKQLVNSYSVGAYYNQEWKGRFPSQAVGHYSKVGYKKEPVKSYGPSLSFPTAPVAVDATRKNAVVVHFMLNHKEYEFFASPTDSVSEAVNELHEWAKKVGATASPTKAVIEFV